jgi:hypothetical protein
MREAIYTIGRFDFWYSLQVRALRLSRDVQDYLYPLRSSWGSPHFPHTFPS